MATLRDPQGAAFSVNTYAPAGSPRRPQATVGRSMTDAAIETHGLGTSSGDRRLALRAVLPYGAAP